jgi:hypothetical protein
MRRRRLYGSRVPVASGPVRDQPHVHAIDVTGLDDQYPVGSLMTKPFRLGLMLRVFQRMWLTRTRV